MFSSAIFLVMYDMQDVRVVKVDVWLGFELVCMSLSEYPACSKIVPQSVY
jgi:hypothetical protein